MFEGKNAMKVKQKEKTQSKESGRREPCARNLVVYVVIDNYLIEIELFIIYLDTIFIHRILLNIDELNIYNALMNYIFRVSKVSRSFVDSRNIMLQIKQI